jgi:hypothetical protein
MIKAEDGRIVSDHDEMALGSFGNVVQSFIESSSPWKNISRTGL